VLYASFMPETPQEAFDRGVIAGDVAAQLNQHAQHLTKINGSMADVAHELKELNLAIQKLSQQAVARDATVLTTAAALKDADQARRDKDTHAWTPFTRLMAALGGLAALGSLIGLYLLLRG
jgi:hypothetical protein